MKHFVGSMKPLAASAILSILVTHPAFAWFEVDGIGNTPKEAVDNAKDNARDVIKSRNGEGCIGLKDGKIIKYAEKNGDLYHIVIYVSEHAGSCKQKMNSINVFGQNIPF